MNIILLYKYITTYLSIPQFIDIYVVSRYFSSYTCLCIDMFPFFFIKYIKVDFLGHIASVYLNLSEIAKQKKSGLLFYISTKIVWVFQLHLFTNTWYYQSFYFYLF